MRELVLRPAHASERRFPLDTALVVGREPGCDVLEDHPSLSRRHARVLLDGDDAYVEDLKSKNGTWVNGVRIAGRVRVKDGDAIAFGEVFATLAERVASQLIATRIVQRDPHVHSTVDRVPIPKVRDPAGRLATMLEVARVLARPAPTEVLLGLVVDLACRVLEVDRAVLLLDGPDGLRPAVVRPAGHTPSWSRTIAEWTRTNGVAALFGDAATDPRVAEAASVHALTITSSMAAPLHAGGRLAGVLYVDARRRMGAWFGEPDLELLAAFADQASMALENAGLRNQLEEEAARRGALQRFFPTSTLEVLLASGGEVPSTETDVTALFCDLSDYTRIAAGMPPLEVLGLLNRYYSTVSPIVFAHGGTLEKFVGDALLAVWGAPVQRPDDADRAVKAALALPAAVRAIPLTVHVGVHSGRVAAGNVGSAEVIQYATVGDATNVAARICSTAGPGEIAVSDATWARLRDPPAGAVRVDGVELKGKAEPFTLWRVRG